jgi:hypothetical protein
MEAAMAIAVKCQRKSDFGRVKVAALGRRLVAMDNNLSIPAMKSMRQRLESYRMIGAGRS